MLDEPASRKTTKVTVWSVIYAVGTRRLEIVISNLNQLGYYEITDRRLLSQLRLQFPDNDCIFMNDATPKSVKAHSDNRGIRVPDWSGNSPDLNSIQYLWKEMKDEIS